MQRIITLFSLVMCVVLVNAQTIIKGQLLDSLTNQGEPYATVRVCKEKQMDKPVAMAVSDMDGNFSVSVNQKGELIVLFSSVGRATVKRNISVGAEKEINLGKVFFSDDENALAGVEVVALKPVIRMEADKMTYSVEDDSEAKAQTILDVLRKVPMVVVDGQDNITVNGSSSFKVYLDGKPNPMLSSNASQIFKAMPASMVKSIEVVTNPGAKYDAEGAGGILDIKLAATNGGNSGNGNESFNGYNGSVTLTGGNRGLGANVYVAGQQGKFTYNANGGYNYMKNGAVEVDMNRDNNGSAINYHQSTENSVPFANGSIALGYELDSLSTVNASFGLTKFQMTNDGNPTTTMKGGYYGNGFTYGGRQKNTIGNNSFNGSVDYQHFFSNARTSSITVTYQLNANPSKNDSWTTFDNVPTEAIGLVDLTNRNSIGRMSTVEHVAQADLVTKLNAHSTLNSGLKYANRTSASDMDFYNEDVLDANQSTDYENTDQIGAAYAELANTWNKCSLKTGLRYEHTWQNVEFHEGKGDNFSKNYGNLVPSLSTSYSLMPGSSVGLNYNMRISRPGITYLNPYVDQSDPTALTYGNENLEVEKSHNISAVFNFFSPILIMNATLTQTFANGGIEQYSFFKDNKLNTTYGNIVNKRITALNIFASMPLSKSTRFVFNGGTSYNDFRSETLDTKNSAWQRNGMFSLQQTLPKQWNMSATVISNSSRYTLQGHSSGFNMGILSVTKKLFDDRLTLTASGVTGLSKGGKLHFDQYSEGKDFSNKMSVSVPVTRVMVNVIWNFGNTKKQFQKHQSKVQNDYIENKSSTETIGSAGQM